MKTFALESLFNKVAFLQFCNFIKKRLHHRCFLVDIASKIYKNTYFDKHLQKAAFEETFVNCRANPSTQFRYFTLMRPLLTV